MPQRNPTQPATYGEQQQPLYRSVPAAIVNGSVRTGRAVADAASVMSKGMVQLPAKTVQAGKSMLFDPTQEQQPMSPLRFSTVTQPVQRQTAKRIFRG